LDKEKKSKKEMEENFYKREKLLKMERAQFEELSGQYNLLRANYDELST
jgi:hypothetical protein